ncbi:hypothetical protein WA026_007914 [Henosepilachna vigintioctopunctata]|uniref:Uncharacterized protein n=1 Tax=Henosepilachna vigintioctopunctata TaxID=420089 RepID=A0AAW1U5V5_9CUCU
MSCKVNMTNGVTLNFENQLYTKTPPLDATVKFAGEEAKDRLYEPKHKKKVVRVLTVIAYVFFVSLAAIMLSLYYIFIWHGEQSKPAQQIVRIYSKCDTGVFAEMQRQLVNNEFAELRKHPTPSTTTEENTTWLDDDFYSFSEEEFSQSSSLLKKLFYKKYPNTEND